MKQWINGNLGKIIYSFAGAIITFLALQIFYFYIDAPNVYAKKEEVKEEVQAVERRVTKRLDTLSEKIDEIGIYLRNNMCRCDKGM